MLKIFSVCSRLVFFYYIAFTASFGYNIRYNHSAKVLTEAIIDCAERGESGLALKELKMFNETITPAYMKINLIENAKTTSEKLKNKNPIGKA